MKCQNGAPYFREAFHDARHAIGKGTNCEVKTWPKAVSCYSLGKGTYYEVKSWPKADSQNLAKGCELPLAWKRNKLQRPHAWKFRESATAVLAKGQMLDGSTSNLKQPSNFLHSNLKNPGLRP